MSITTEIQRINGGKSAIRTLASQKNINIPSSSLIDSFASILGAQWPDCTFNVTYDGDKIRGRTMKWNQLFGLNPELTPSNGLNYTLNPDGSIRVYGTTTASNVTKNIYTTSLPAAGKELIGINIIKGTFPFNSSNYTGFREGYVGWTSQGGALFGPNSFKVFTRDSTNVVLQMSIAEAGTTVDFTFFAYCVYLGSGDVDESTVQREVVYAKDHPEYDAGSLAYSFYKGIKLGEYDYIDTTNNKLVLGGAETDLGGLVWRYPTPYFDTASLASVIKRPTDLATAGDIITPIYQTVSGGDAISPTTDMAIGVYTNGNLAIKDSRYNSYVSLTAALSGVKAYYALATPIEIAL